MSITLTKQPSEDLLFAIDFTNRFSDRSTAPTISSVISIVDDKSALSYGTPVISGHEVQFTVGGGTDDVTYKITCKIVTDQDPVVEADVYLAVVEK